MFKLFSSKLYPYLITIAVSIYIATQFLSIASTSNIGVTLEEMGNKQSIVFDFLMTESLEVAIKTAKLPNLIEGAQTNKDEVLTFLAYDTSITVYDVTFFDIYGNLLSESGEDVSSFKTLFKELNPIMIVEPTIANIRYSETYSDYVMDLLIPVTQQGKIIGLMWQVESFDRINQAMSDVSLLQTGEFYIINEQGQVLTELKDVASGVPLTIHNSTLINSTSDGFEKTAYLNYENISVYGFHTNLNLNNWTLIVEVHESEVLNTLSNMNAFMLHCGALILACSKLLDPVIKKREAIKFNKLQLTTELKTLKTCEESQHPNRFFCYILFTKDIYLKFCHQTNILLLFIFIIISVFFIGSQQIDQSIQTNLDLANHVNTKLVSYYLEEQKSRFQFSTRTYNEYINADSSIDDYLQFCLESNSNLLNIVLLDDTQTIINRADETDINFDYATEAIKDENIVINSIGISDIFYDSNYSEYVMYFSASWFTNSDASSYHCIGVISIDNLTKLITNNELQSSRIFSILNNDKIMYSNTYTATNLPSTHYTYIKAHLSNHIVNSYSSNAIKKYPNSLGEEVFGSYENIKPNDLMLYGSYSSVNNTDWNVLYEEPVQDARQQLIDGIYNLIADIINESIKNVVNNLK